MSSLDILTLPDSCEVLIVVITFRRKVSQCSQLHLSFHLKLKVCVITTTTLIYIVSPF